MNATTFPESKSQPVKVMKMIQELQAETIGFVFPVMAMAGYLVLANFRLFERAYYADISALVLAVSPFVLWHYRRRNYVASVWLLVGVLAAVDLFIAVAGPFTPVILLLALPVGIAAVYLGIAAGALAAVVCSVLVFALRNLGGYESLIINVSLIGMWGMLGVVALRTQPLRTAMQWYAASYEQSRRQLEETRDTQQRLHETLKDLADANVQLTRLNSLARALRSTAEEARKTKERFVANVSHELRTPLNMIIGFCEMIVQMPDVYGERLPPKLMADLDVILRNSQHLSRLVDDVLDLSQVDAGEMVLTRERASLAEIITSASVAVRPLFQSKDLYLKLVMPADLPEIFCDSTRVRQVVINLLSNAGRFTSEGGVTVAANRENGHVVVSVADTGPGISADAREKIFKPFHQLDGTVRRRYGGSGLGLSVSQKFIELHGGEIWYESDVGQGTTFFFRLPIDPPMPDTPAISRWFSPYLHYEERTRPSLAPVPQERPRFVVWESGEAISRMLRRYVDGVEVVHVSNLAAAVSELTKTPARALLVNATTVGDTLEQIVDSATLPYGTPAIVCSVPSTERTARVMGAQDYLVKPVTRDVLMRTAESMCPNRGTLLVVDDEPDMLRLFRRILASSARGYRVLTASDGKEGLNLLRDHHPDAVFLDLVMENGDGFWFLAQKSQDPVVHDIPVAVISARDPEGQPIVTNAIAATRGGELSVRRLLACIDELSSILSAGSPKDHRLSISMSAG